jgi:hypothetical protein
MRVAKQQRHRIIMNVPVAFGLLTLGVLPIAGSGAAPNARQILDRQLSAAEHDVMGVVEAMPAGKFNFAPSAGAFKNVRTFGVQARHIAFCLNEVAVALLGEPMLPHTDQEGPKNPIRPGRMQRFRFLR